MNSCGVGRFAGLKQLLDKIDSPARPIQFISEQLVGWACGGAETTMHAFSKDFARLLTKRAPLKR